MRIRAEYAALSFRAASSRRSTCYDHASSQARAIFLEAIEQTRQRTAANFLDRGM